MSLLPPLASAFQPAENLQRLSANRYPGRGIVTGVSDQGEIIQVYWLMGRSDDSRNRRLRLEDRRVFTEAIDPSKVSKPELTIYDAMLEARAKWFHVVSNGRQTNAVTQGLVDDESEVPGTLALASLLDGWRYEPDPNSTSRITAVYRRLAGGWHLFDFVTIRRAIIGASCDVLAFSYKLPNGFDGQLGFGRCIHTYAGDGNPLPPFVGEPSFMPLEGSVERIADVYWGALDPENRVSLVAKAIPVAGGDSKFVIKNKY